MLFRSALEQPLAELGVDVESVEVQKAGRRHVVRIVVDRDGGVDLDLVAEVSRRASELLDSPSLSDLLTGAFVLEVTSPGVDRPLTQPRHWRRAVGRLVVLHRHHQPGSTNAAAVVHPRRDTYPGIETGSGWCTDT